MFVESIEELEQQLEKKDTEIRQLQDSQNKSQHELQEHSFSTQQKEEKLRENAEKIRELQRELNTKNDLVGSFTIWNLPSPAPFCFEHRPPQPFYQNCIYQNVSWSVYAENGYI